jgi:hypothetical protein
VVGRYVENSVENFVEKWGLGRERLGCLAVEKIVENFLRGNLGAGVFLGGVMRGLFIKKGICTCDIKGGIWLINFLYFFC